ncbi:MAG: LapA family protein [Nitrosospira sp.]
MQLLLIVGIAAAIAAVAFSLQNNIPVTVTLGLWSFDSSLAMVLLLAIGIGAVIALLVSWPGIIKNVWKGSQLRRRVNKLEDDKAALERRVAQLEEELMRISPEPIPEEPTRFLGLRSILLGSEVEKPKE